MQPSEIDSDWDNKLDNLNMKILMRQLDDISVLNERYREFIDQIKDVLGCDGTYHEILDEIRRLTCFDKDPNKYSSMPRAIARASARLTALEQKYKVDEERHANYQLAAKVVADVRSGLGITKSYKANALELDLEQFVEIKQALLKDLVKREDENKK